MNQNRIASILLATALALSAPLSGLPVYVNIAPPAPPVEVKVVAPGKGYFWVGGYHRWTGKAYVWVPGRWALPPHPGAAWVPGHWKNTPHGWVWKSGRWH
jgi:hypothetical protein